MENRRCGVSCSGDARLATANLFWRLVTGLTIHDGAQRAYVDVAISDGAVVALEHDRPERRFGQVHVGARAAFEFDVFLNGQAVVEHADEAGVFGLLAGSVKTRGAEPDVEALPFAGAAAGVARRGRAADALLIDPTMIDGSAVGGFHPFGGAEAVEDLDFVEALEVDAGV